MGKLQTFRLMPDKPTSRLGRALEAIRAYTVGPLTTNSPEIAKYFSDGVRASSGVSVSQETALNYSAVWAATNLIASDVAGLPLIHYRRNGANKERATDTRLYRLLHDQPNPEMTSIIWRQTLQAHALTWGGGFAEIERDGGGRPAALWPITPDRVTPFRRGLDSPLQYRVVNPGNSETIFNAADMLHIPGLGWDGTRGYSVIEKARESIGLGAAAERFGGTFFGNGATFGGVVAYKGPKPKDEVVANTTAAINRSHQGVDQAHKFLTLWNDASYTRLGIPPNDAQFLETRQFQITEIARWFNLPPHKIADLQRATYSNIEQQDLEYYKTTLMHWLTVWEQELMSKLIPALEMNQQLIEHVVEGFLRADVQGRAAFYTTRFNTGSVTPDEIRALENQNPIPGGDRGFVPLNVIPLDKVDAYFEAEIDLKKSTAEKNRLPPPTPVVTPPTPGPTRELERLAEERDLARQRAQQAEDAKDLALATATEIRVELATEQARHQATEAERLRWQQVGETAVETLEAERLRAREAEEMAEVRDAEMLAKAAEALVVLTAEQERHKATEAERARLQHLGETAVAMATQAGEREQALLVRAGSAESVLADVRRRAEALEAEQVQLRSMLTETQTAAAFAEATRSEIDRSRTAEQDQIRAQGYRLAETERALRDVLVHAVQCLVARESDRARKAQRSPAKLAQWAGDFYPLHEDFCRESLRYPLAAWRAITGQPDRVDVVLPAYLDQGRRAMQAVAEQSDPETLGPNVEHVLRRWETERVDGLVAALTKEPL